MKTFDQLKKSLEYMSITDAEEKMKRAQQGLPYAYVEEVAADALHYINQLENIANEQSKSMRRSDDKIYQLTKEIERLHNTLSGVMHFVDKWLENEKPYDGESDPEGDEAVRRAANARKIALRAIEEAEWRNIQWNSTAAHNPTKWRKDDKEKTLVNFLLFSPDYGVDIGNYLEPAGTWLIMGLPVKNVTHWAELPQPPKEETK